ncbi:hypothetical protein AB0H88_41180 [Nonomuraea sp. NPDC050680]|uniref:hypothetical protein n=1 Tax=Nonomuraea sp. NPDC050680 TaxID=3154630 RepID=UPI0033CF1F71
MGEVTSGRPVSELADTGFLRGESVPEQVGELPFVLVDAQGRTAGLVGPAGPGPAIAIPADTPLAVVLSSEEVLDALLAGADALVLIDPGERPVGVVPVPAVRAELARALADPHELGAGDGLGRPRSLAPPLRIRCRTCGEVNTFTRFQQTETYDCVSGHDFVPFYGAR